MATTIAHPVEQPQSRTLIAPLWHTIVLVAMLCVPLVSGFIVQHQKTANNQIFASHSMVMMRFYVPVIIYEWFLVVFVWFGIRIGGVTVSKLIGGRWLRAKDIAIDIGLGLLMVIAMLILGGTLGRVLGPGHGKGSSIILPEGGFELAVWVVVAFTAGVVEEFVCRGYLQTQLARLGLPVSAAILAQAMIFSVGHIYEGVNAVIVITVYAVLFGLLAWWRRSLRPGMIGHFCFDFLAAFLPRG